MEFDKHSSIKSIWIPDISRYFNETAMGETQANRESEKLVNVLRNWEVRKGQLDGNKEGNNEKRQTLKKAANTLRLPSSDPISTWNPKSSKYSRYVSHKEKGVGENIL